MSILYHEEIFLILQYKSFSDCLWFETLVVRTYICDICSKYQVWPPKYFVILACTIEYLFSHFCL